MDNLPEPTNFALKYDKQNNMKKTGQLIHFVTDDDAKEKKILTKPFQKVHVSDILTNIYPNSKFAISASPAGSGKTFAGMRLYQKLKKRNKVAKLLIIGPSMSIMTWMNIVADYNIKDAMFIGYDSLRGSSHADKKKFKGMPDAEVIGKWGAIQHIHSYTKKF